ncbi:hydroxymethylbilane synthase [Limnoglobus roseus]|uniref:Porphobilinogen deaminase n=1 Tax=Limnoglobus roseus TaxID=2598579 RepID=A0A5C1ADR3_9BACT|nr:hydroxymethylbilane synthase [Limnoglobus roseus]QEL16146.1 hydroxymethylbilane synthase [Limnoglobus roseus]
MTTPLKLGTRGSPLALWQANHVAALLRPILDPRPVELVRIETHGDRDQASALSQMGGFGVFTKAIQNAILDKTADVAVHSLKDLPTIPTDGVILAATPERAPNGDAFLSTKYGRFDDLPSGATLGTSSLRRRAQILNYRPDLRLVELRGNVDTRLRKLDEQSLDGIILAEAGLLRLGLGSRITEILDPTWMLPAVGQGAIGLECREADAETRGILEAINHAETWSRVLAERAMLWTLGGGCLVPIGATSKLADGVLTVRGAVLSPDGRRRITATHRGPADTPVAVGQELAAKLKDEGAEEMLATGIGERGASAP